LSFAESPPDAVPTKSSPSRSVWLLAGVLGAASLRTGERVTVEGGKLRPLAAAGASKG